MDPYDVLGLRPQASAQEIELAYKGRRSQYHPDRYTDPDGARWATSKMQEVNAAYALLSDPVRKAQHDRSKSQGATSRSSEPRRESPQPKPSSPHAASLSLKQALTDAFSVGIGCRRVFVAPNIPMQKLTQALQSYGKGRGVRDIAALVDTTVMGGAREGLMFTEDGILFKELMQPGADLSWSDVNRISARDNTVLINGHSFMECTLVDAHEIERLVGGAANFLRSRQGTPGTGRAQPQQRARPSGSAAPALFEVAKTQIVNLCSVLEEFERPDRELIDREHIVEYFDVLKRAAHDPEARGAAEQELKLIIALTHLPELIGKDPRDERLQVMLRILESDSPLVMQLRSLMRQMRDFAIHEEESQNQAQRKARTDAFFGRS